MAVFKLQRQSRVEMAEAIWSTKPKIFTIWPFTEKVCWPHIKIEWITYLTKQENMTINIITRMFTMPIHFLHWHSVNFKNLNEIMLLPCSRSFNGFSSHWEQNPKIPYLPCRQTPSPPALPLAHFTAHPPACWSSNVPSVLLPQDMCTCCFLSRTFLPDTCTLHSFTLFLYLLKAVISVKPSPLVVTLFTTWLVYFPCPAWKVRQIRTGTLLYPQLIHSGFVINICWLHE